MVLLIPALYCALALEQHAASALVSVARYERVFGGLLKRSQGQVTMSSVKELTEVGKSIGISGPELLDFVRTEREYQEKKDADIRKEKERLARDERAHQLEIRRQDREILELQLKVQEAKLEKIEKDDGHVNQGVPKAKAPKLPFFDDSRDDVDSYLQRFERYAHSQGWSEDCWAISLSALLKGKALDVYSRIAEDEAGDYRVLKEALLKRYRLTQEGFRQKFRSAKPELGETAPQFVVRLDNLFTRWVDLAKADKNYDGVKDLLLREQFINASSRDLALFIKERQPKNVHELAHLAEHFQEARGTTFGVSPSCNDKKYQQRQVPYKKQHDSKPTTSSGTQGTGDFTRPPRRVCFICERPGHLARDCRDQRARARYHKTAAMKFGGKSSTQQNVKQPSKTQSGEHQEVKQCTCTCPLHGQTTTPTSSQTSQQSTVTSAACLVVERCLEECCVETDHVTLRCGHELPVLSAACTGHARENLPVSEGWLGEQKVQVLRDSGCTGTVVRRELVSEDMLTGETRMCVLIDGTVRRFPVARIFVRTPYFTGYTNALCMQKPIYDLIIGNITDTSPQLFSRDAPRATDEPHDEVSSHHLSTPHAPSAECQAEQVQAVQTRAQKAAEHKPQRQMKVPDRPMPDISQDDFRVAQQEDASLHRLRDLASTGEQRISGKNNTTHFYADKGLLYRSFRSPKVAYGDPLHQLVVPVRFRKSVMAIAHDSILGGHQGIRKTTDKILSSFYWPGIQSDVARFCRSCDSCQRTIHKGRVNKVPLGTMPLIETPFQRIAVDIVGPIKPSTDKGNRYILTIIDYATRYPEAVPLRSIETTRVAEALVEVFSRVGIPREILTDQGAQFTGDVMKEVSRLLSLKQLTTTPYHPACNGLVERFNGTLKQMLKRMCMERPKDWDRFIGPLLFAYRETPQASLGFSPFELLYGRTVRGPMAILKELWSGEKETSEVRSTYEFVLDLRERLEQTCKLAQEELRKATARSKGYYNRKSRMRRFKVGDLVLLLLPTDSNKLLMQWKGPFSVLERLGDLDYRIQIGDKAKTFHANLLKKYINREDVNTTGSPEVDKRDVIDVVSCAVIGEEDCNDESPSELEYGEDIKLPTMKSKESSSDVAINSELPPEKVSQVKRLLGNYKDILTDLPGQTNVVMHEIRVTTEHPVRLKPYPLPHAVRDSVKVEVKSMLDMGIIERSDSPYASPIVLIRKKDGSNRFCIDYRQLNKITIFDAEPMPVTDEIFAHLSKDKFFSKIDLAKGYWQIPVKLEDRQKTAFVTPDGLYQFRTMPFGLVNAPATFSRLMRIVLQGLQHVDNYIDDVLVHTPDWETHLKTLKEVFKRLYEAGLTARPTKCMVGHDRLEFLGHIIGQGRLEPHQDKMDKILQAPRPQTKKQLRSFLGLVGYYRKFIPNFAAVAVPLTDRTKNKEPNKVVWEDSQELAFQSLKQRMVSSPILHLPDVEKDFILRTDASSTGIGAVLLQEHNDTKFPIAYASKKLLPREQRYSTIERECLAIVWAIGKFQSYLYGKPFILETDHQPLVYLQKAKVVNSRIMRWALALQPYRMRIEAIKGSQNVGADFLSRLSHQG